MAPGDIDGKVHADIAHIPIHIGTMYPGLCSSANAMKTLLRQQKHRDGKGRSSPLFNTFVSALAYPSNIRLSFTAFATPALVTNWDQGSRPKLSGLVPILPGLLQPREEVVAMRRSGTLVTMALADVYYWDTCGALSSPRPCESHSGGLRRRAAVVRS